MSEVGAVVAEGGGEAAPAAGGGDVDAEQAVGESGKGARKRALREAALGETGSPRTGAAGVRWVARKTGGSETPPLRKIGTRMAEWRLVG